MSSAIKTIYTAIAGLSPEYDSDISISVRDYDAIANIFNPADAPMRMLLVSAPTSEAEDTTFIAIGSGYTMRARWRITDRLFMKPVMEGLGLEDNTANLLGYIASYIDQIRTLRAPSSQSHIVSFRCTPGVYWWPNTETGVAYFGVDCQIIVEEVISN